MEAKGITSQTSHWRIHTRTYFPLYQY